jgi:hypothetical protein
MEDLEVTLSLPDPLFSVILWRMFVRRPLEIYSDKVQKVCLMREEILSYLLIADEDTISSA